MKTKRGLLAALILTLLLLACTVSVQAAQYAKKEKAEVSLTSNRAGWHKINGKYYYYNQEKRLMCGQIAYKGNYYYCTSNGARYTGWVTNGTKKMYFGPAKYRNRWLYLPKINRRYCFDPNGYLITGRWVTYRNHRYYLSPQGPALTSQWLSQNGQKYYFRSNATMVTGWQKIGNYKYYFYKNGRLARNTWIGSNYVDSAGRLQPKSYSNATGSRLIYNSSSLHVELNRKSKNGISYWVAHIRTSSPSQVRSALSYGTYGGARQTTSSAVTSNGGIIGVNGSAFDYNTGRPSPLGMCIKNGRIYGDYMTSYSVMAVNKNGLMYTPRQGLMGKDLLKAGVKDTYNFGPVLIDNGSPQLPWAETSKYYPRTAVGMVKPNEYVLLVTNTGSYSGLNHWDMVSEFQSYKCQYAYNLDGGGSSTLVFRGKVLNRLIGGTQRACGDFLYFTN